MRKLARLIVLGSVVLGFSACQNKVERPPLPGQAGLSKIPWNRPVSGVDGGALANQFPQNR